MTAPIYVTTLRIWGFPFLHTFSNIRYFVLFDDSYLDQCECLFWFAFLYLMMLNNGCSDLFSAYSVLFQPPVSWFPSVFMITYCFPSCYSVSPVCPPREQELSLNSFHNFQQNFAYIRCLVIFDFNWIITAPENLRKHHPDYRARINIFRIWEIQGDRCPGHSL